MDGWIACFFVLFLDLVFARDIPINASSIVKQIDSCPDEGYFFRRDPSPNAIGSGPCYLCFCQNNGTAICWERERDRCDVEKYHHHRVGRNTRFRRSFTDIFFRDASRDFFNRSLPQQCKPYESSFSDGCPPADWCIGCTVCDCDANGYWDCHILSFCDGQEKKKKVRKPRKNVTNRRTSVKNKSNKPKSTTTKPTIKMINKIVRKKKAENKTQKNFEKVVKKMKHDNKIQSKKAVQKPKKSNAKKQAKTSPRKTTPPKKSNAKTSQSKKPQQNYSKVNVRKVKAIKKIVATEKPVPLQRSNVKREINLSPNSNETIEVGQKIVKRVMTAVHKLIAREIQKKNATLVAKLAEKKSCEEEKMRDKRTYDELSRHNSKRKNRKHKRRKTFTIEDFIDNDRFKREILNEAEAKFENLSVITLSPDVNAVIPLKTIKYEYSNSTNHSSDHVIQSSSPSPQHEYYYKYFIKNDLNRTTTMGSTKNTTINNEPNVVINLGIPRESINNTSTNAVENSTTGAMNPDFNDLKFTKWFIVKVRKGGRKKSTKKLLPKPKARHTFRDIQTTERTYFENIITKKDKRTKYHPQNHKHGIHFTKNHTRLFSYTNSPIIKNKTDVTGLHTILQNIIKEMNRNKTAWHKIKPKIGIMKYVRDFFHSIFSKKRPSIHNHNIYGIGRNEDHTLQILCENIGPCNINRRNKFVLKQKLKQLNKEIDKILRSIRTIKGLLHLLDLPNTDKTHYFSKHSPFQNEIHKLGIVLRDNVEEMNTTLTFTQMTQINYIKKNTQTFVECVQKFAEILKDILAIIKPTTGHDFSTESRPRKLNNKTSFRKIKKLLYKHNLVQNNFMRKMYELINGVESQTTTTERAQVQIRDPKASYNDSDIENHSRRIIENLRRLKNLAQVLSSKRKKRKANSGDGALEYLLTLMEYLILQNHWDTVPANDGIDVLLDAIYSAPEIKPHRTTVEVGSQTEKSNSNSEYSEQITENSISESKETSNEVNKVSKDDKVITINKESKESKDDKDEKEDVEDKIHKQDMEDKIHKEDMEAKIHKEDNFLNYDYTLRSENIKKKNSSWEVKPITQEVDDVTAMAYFKVFNYTTELYKTNNNSWQVEQNTQFLDEVTSKVYYKVFKADTPISYENVYETTTEYNILTDTRSNDNEKKVRLNKLEKNVDKIKKFEIYYADIDDEGNNNILLTTNTTAVNKRTTEEQTTLTTKTAEMPTTIGWVVQNEITKKKQLNESSSESQELTNDDKKFKIDWIEQMFDREIREFNQINVSAPTLTSPWTRASITEPITKATDKYAGNVSGITAEVDDSTGNKIKSSQKSNFEDVIQEKQMTFLNSLDYGTEKPNFEDGGDSKDDNRVEEGFPAYFV